MNVAPINELKSTFLERIDYFLTKRVGDEPNLRKIVRQCG
jgi:hypothetical protein